MRRTVSLAAMVIGWAAVAQWGTLAIVPPYVATGIPRTWFLFVALLSFAVAAAASAFASAWRDSGMNRLLRRLIM